MGFWAPKIDYNKLQKIMFLLLAHKPFPLTGNEMRFIRQYSEMSMETFGQIFGVSHAAVSKWEKRGNKVTHADINTERLIRLFMLEELEVNNKEFRNGFREVLLEKSLGEKQVNFEPLALDVEKEELLAV